MTGWDFSAELARVQERGLYRRARRLTPVGPVEADLQGQRCLVFCSNDYLGLAQDPRVVEACADAAVRCGVGSGSAHLISGHRSEHAAFEEELAGFLGRERVLLFSTGYMANIGVIDALVGRGDVVFQDRLNHASLIDGSRLSGAIRGGYRHADCADLARQLAEVEARRRLIVTDGVFSMDGDVAPLPQLAPLARAHDALLIVDDAHGLGVVGAGGGGSTELCGVDQAQVPVLVGTLGKAFGTFGAFVAGSHDLIEFLIQRSRTFVFTTAMPPALAAASRASLRLVRAEGWRRQRLQELIARFRAGAAQLGLPVLPSTTPIQPLLVGQADAAVSLSQALLERGILVSAIRYPTVPEGSARLRITFSAAHTDAHVDRLLDALAATWVPLQEGVSASLA